MPEWTYGKLNPLIQRFKMTTRRHSIALNGDPVAQSITSIEVALLPRRLGQSAVTARH